jgi:hypothetical protein
VCYAGWLVSRRLRYWLTHAATQQAEGLHLPRLEEITIFRPVQLGMRRRHDDSTPFLYRPT